MTRFILDTNIVIALINKTASPLGERVRSYQQGVIALSALVVYELYYGAFASGRRERNLAEIELLRFPVLPFGAEDARQAGRIRADLRAAGSLIGANDLLIAGQALARNLTLVPYDVREFRRVPGLQVEDWLQN